MKLVLDLDPDRLGEPGRLVEPCVGVAERLPAQVRQGDDGAGAAGELGIVADGEAQCACSSA